MSKLEKPHTKPRPKTQVGTYGRPFAVALVDLFTPQKRLRVDDGAVVVLDDDYYVDAATDVESLQAQESGRSEQEAATATSTGVWPQAQESGQSEQETATAASTGIWSQAQESGHAEPANAAKGTATIETTSKDISSDASVDPRATVSKDVVHEILSHNSGELLQSFAYDGQPPRLPQGKKRQGRANAPRDVEGRAGRRTKPEKPEEDFDSMSMDERAHIIAKWRGLAGGAQSPEGLRLYMLIAAIIHPKTSESVVHSCMVKLQAWAQEQLAATAAETSENVELSPSILAAMPKEALEEALSTCHWHKVKAERILAAMAKLVDCYSGQVPNSKEQLLALPGIGPKLGRLLAFLFEVLNTGADGSVGGEEIKGDESEAERGSQT